MPPLPAGWRWVRRYPSDPWFMELMHDGKVRASVHLSPGRDRPYSLAYKDVGSSRMGGHSHNTRMAAVRSCERWAIALDREERAED